MTDRLAFMPCLECRVAGLQSGSTGLCVSCSHNRNAINDLSRIAYAPAPHDGFADAVAKLDAATDLVRSFWHGPDADGAIGVATHGRTAWAMHVALVELAHVLGVK